MPRNVRMQKNRWKKIFRISEKGQIWNKLLGKKTLIISDSNDVWHSASKVLNRLPIMKKPFMFLNTKKVTKKFQTMIFIRPKKYLRRKKCVTVFWIHSFMILGSKVIGLICGIRFASYPKTSKPAKRVDFRLVVSSIGKLEKHFRRISKCLLSEDSEGGVCKTWRGELEIIEIFNTWL